MTQLKAKLLLPILLIFFVCALVSVSTLLYMASKIQSLNMHEILEKQSRLYDFVINSKLEAMSAVGSVLVNNATIAGALEAKDRNKLYNLSKSIYDTLDKSGITHFYYIDINKTVLFRMHNPSCCGDILSRFGIQKSSAIGVPVGGVEAGINARLALRYTIPVFIKDKIVGFIELGQDMDKIFGEMSAILDCDVTLLVNKNDIDIDLYKKYRNDNRFKELGGYVVSASNLTSFDKLSDNIVACNKPDLLQIIFGFQNHACLPFYDVSGSQIGKLVFSLKNENAIYYTIFKIFFVSTAILLIITGLIFYFYYRYVLNVSNIVEKQKMKLKYSAMTDHLTGLYNRRYFETAAASKLLTAKRFKQIAIFAIVDIDKFKLYNDTYGHIKGDEVLARVANILKTHCKRSTDIVARLGGEEFAIFTMSDAKESLYTHMELVLSSVQNAQIEHVANQDFNVVTISMGCAICNPNEDISLNDLYKKADEALYNAKESGRNKVVFYASTH